MTNSNLSNSVAKFHAQGTTSLPDYPARYSMENLPIAFRCQAVTVLEGKAQQSLAHCDVDVGPLHGDGILQKLNDPLPFVS